MLAQTLVRRAITARDTALDRRAASTGPASQIVAPVHHAPLAAQDFQIIAPVAQITATAHQETPAGPAAQIVAPAHQATTADPGAQIIAPAQQSPPAEPVAQIVAPALQSPPADPAKNRVKRAVAPDPEIAEPTSKRVRCVVCSGNIKTDFYRLIWLLSPSRQKGGDAHQRPMYALLCLLIIQVHELRDVCFPRSLETKGIVSTADLARSVWTCLCCGKCAVHAVQMRTGYVRLQGSRGLVSAVKCFCNACGVKLTRNPQKLVRADGSVFDMTLSDEFTAAMHEERVNPRTNHVYFSACSVCYGPEPQIAKPKAPKAPKAAIDSDPFEAAIDLTAATSTPPPASAASFFAMPDESFASLFLLPHQPQIESPPCPPAAGAEIPHQPQIESPPCQPTAGAAIPQQPQIDSVYARMTKYVDRYDRIVDQQFARKLKTLCLSKVNHDVHLQLLRDILPFWDKIKPTGFDEGERESLGKALDEMGL